MRRLTAIAYYARQVPRVLLGLGPLRTVAGLFLGRVSDRPLIVVRTSGLTFRVRTAMDAWIVGETILDRPYERGATIQGCRTILDIGAGLGDFAIYAARSCPDAVVLAYEPSPESFGLLEENLRLNGCRNVVARPLAVVGSPGPRQLEVGLGAAVQHVLSTRSPTTIEVRALTLDELFLEHRVTRCDFLKIDVEGAEYEILMNASEETLRRITRIAFEYHPCVPGPTVEELREFLTSRQFTVSVHPSSVHRHFGYLYVVNHASVEESASI